MPPDTLKVDRSTRWGNPFRIDSKAKIADRAKVVAALRAKLTDVLRLALRAPGVFAGERGAARHANLCRLCLGSAGQTTTSQQVVTVLGQRDGRYEGWFRGARVLNTVEDIRRELAGRNLACWCPLDEPCHADVLLEIANSAATF